MEGIGNVQNGRWEGREPFGEDEGPTSCGDGVVGVGGGVAEAGRDLFFAPVAGVSNESEKEEGKPETAGSFGGRWSGDDGRTTLAC